MKHLAQIINQRAKELNISQEELSQRIGLSRYGLHKALNINNTLKVSDFLKLLDALKLKPRDVFENAVNPEKNENWKLDYDEIANIYRLLDFKGLNIEQFKLCMYDSKTKRPKDLNLNSINYKSLNDYCCHFKIPFDLFLKNEFRNSFRWVSVKHYIEHNSLIEITEEYNLFEHYYQKELFSTVSLIRSLTKKGKSEISIDETQFIYSIKAPNAFNQVDHYKISIVNTHLPKPILFIGRIPPVSVSSIPEHVMMQIFKEKLKTYSVSDFILVDFVYIFKDKYTNDFFRFDEGLEQEASFFFIKHQDETEYRFDENELKSFLKIE